MNYAISLIGQRSSKKIYARLSAEESKWRCVHPQKSSSRNPARSRPSNLAYYKALSARDVRSMKAVWTCAADNILIAPPVNPHSHVGWAAIKWNWEAYWPTI